MLIDDGQWQMGWEMNQAATAELAYEAGGAPAEVQTGGVLQNAIPKEGGNTFRGTFHTVFGHENLNGSNQTPELQAVLGEVNRNAYSYNVNPGYGGPIVQDPPVVLRCVPAPRQTRRGSRARSSRGKAHRNSGRRMASGRQALRASIGTGRPAACFGSATS